MALGHGFWDFLTKKKQNNKKEKFFSFFCLAKLARLCSLKKVEANLFVFLDFALYNVFIKNLLKGEITWQKKLKRKAE